MKARKLWIAGVACCCGAIGVFATAGVAAPAAHPAKTRVTIYPWPDGLFGYVKSPKSARCADHRRVVVFRQHGKRKHPQKDTRIATERAKRNHGFFQWSLETNRTGRFYAKGSRAPGCRADFSRTLRLAPGTTGTGDNAGAYPRCGPYVAEAGASVCHFDELYLDLDQQRPFVSCRWGDDDANCPGVAKGGPFPWGRTPGGGNPQVEFFWQNTHPRSVTAVTYREGFGNTGVAHLGGTVPSTNSPNYTIRDAYAMDDRGYPNGLHFYTPDIPGQVAGEPGGPLEINVINGTGTDLGAVAKIKGYLYVCLALPCVK